MIELLTHVASPWTAYLLLLALLTADAFVPVLPTQAIMITSGALTVYGGLSLPAVIAVGATGVLLGDLACYLLGRAASHGGHGPGRLTALLRRCAALVGPDAAQAADRRRGRARRAAARFTRGLRRPGPLVLLLCRFVPGGRMAACYNAGRQRYPYRFFLTYDLAAAVGWATYGGLVGHLGGTALTQSAWRLFAVAAVAAVIFGTAGWVLALAGGRHDADADADDQVAGVTPARAASIDAPPPRSTRTGSGRS